MLLVFTSQAVAADGIISCDMDMHDMVMMDNGDMDMSNSKMDTDKMDCCDASCALDCGLSMTIALVESGSIETQSLTSTKIAIPQDMAIANSHLVLFRPPISA